MLPYENIFGIRADDAVRLADGIIAEGQHAIFFADDSAEPRAKWLMKDQSGRSMNMSNHAWNMLDSVLLAHSSTRDERFLANAVAVAQDWSRLFANKQSFDGPVGTDQMAWYDMAVGLRAYRLAYILDALDQPEIGVAYDAELLDRSLALHVDYLAADANIVFHNNHGFYQAAGQLAMGRRLADRSPGLAASEASGRQRLSQMLDMQFSSEGVHLEHSPSYHRMVYATLRGLIDAGLVDDPKILDRSNQIEEALSWFIRPDGQIANIGDSDCHNYRVSAAVAEKRWHTDAMRYVTSSGATGTPQEGQYRLFGEAGYFVARLPNERRPSRARDSYLLMHGGFHSRTHKHADHLTFLWSDLGQPILVDSGRYGYVGKTAPGSDLHRAGFWYSDPKRVYCETTRAHNCLAFDGRDYPRRDTEPFGSALRSVAWDESQRIVTVDAEVMQHGSIAHRRRLFLRPGRWLICLDHFEDVAGGLHDVTQWFHFAPDLRLEKQDEATYSAAMRGNVPPLVVRSLSRDLRDSDHLRGSKDPELQGWIAPMARQFIPNDAVGFNVSGRTSASVATMFCLASDYVEVDTTLADDGNSGLFRWKANRGQHELRFDQHPARNFKLEYDARLEGSR